MDYVYGSYYIIKNKLYNFDIFSKNTPRIKPKISWYKRYSYFYSSSNKIIDGLFLGSSFNAYNLTELKSNDIDVIINITDEIDNFHEANQLITYYKFPIKDNNYDDISNILSMTTSIIEQHLSKGDNILVHCFMGASRSASVIIHYLMNKNNWTYDYTKNFVMDKRPLINLSHKFDDMFKKMEISIQPT